MTGLAVRARVVLALVCSSLLVVACAADEESAPAAKTLASADLDVPAPAAKDAPPQDPESTTTTVDVTTSDGVVDPGYAACPTGRWCSALYAPGWTGKTAPDAQGRYLHDF